MAINSKLSQSLKGNDNAKKNGAKKEAPRLSVGGFFANRSAVSEKRESLSRELQALSKVPKGSPESLQKTSEARKESEFATWKATDDANFLKKHQSNSKELGKVLEGNSKLYTKEANIITGELREKGAMARRKDISIPMIVMGAIASKVLPKSAEQERYSENTKVMREVEFRKSVSDSIVVNARVYSKESQAAAKLSADKLRAAEQEAKVYQDGLKAQSKAASVTKSLNALQGSDEAYVKALALQTRQDVKAVVANTAASVKNEVSRRTDNTVSQAKAAADRAAKSVESMRKRMWGK